MMIDVVELDGAALLLQARGRINILTAEGFEAHTRQAIADSDNDVIIDTSEVTYLSTAGLRAFLLLWRELKEDGRGLYICGPQTLHTAGLRDNRVRPGHPLTPRPCFGAGRR